LATKKTLSITDCKKNGVKGRKNEKRKKRREKEGGRKERRKKLICFILPASVF
jgi:hypothetical protein